MWNVKICIVLVKNGYVITLKENQSKPRGMTNIQFVEKNEIDQANILVALDDKILSNIKTIDAIAKKL